MAAPLQGYTEAPFRHFHRVVYGPVFDACFSPFVRVEHGGIRSRDIRDVTSPLNANHDPVPQMIVRDVDEFRILADGLVACGHDRIDVNMGCPFALQLRHGRGAALLSDIGKLGMIADAMRDYSQVTFSVKMRLGVDSPDGWRGAVSVLNRMPLSHVAVHPRTAADGYRGPLRVHEFGLLMSELEHPVIFNGEIHSPADIDSVMADYPEVAGVMIGRGLLARPSMVNEWRERREWTRFERLSAVLRLHDGIYRHYCAALCGDAQVLSKIKSFWEYLSEEIGRRSAKAIRKATTLPRYVEAVNSVADSL